MHIESQPLSMAYHSLYQEHHAKLYQDSLRQEQERNRILRDSNSIKTTYKSNEIMTRKLFQALDQYPDDSLISLPESLPILFSGHILQVLKSVEQAKAILNQTSQNQNCARLKVEAKFIYYLWKVIGKEELPCLQLKRIIFLFHEKKGQELKQILRQMFEGQEMIQQLYETWKALQTDRFYYMKHNVRKAERTQKTFQQSWSSDKKNQTLKVVHQGEEKQKKIKQTFNKTMTHAKGKENDTPFFERLYETQFYKKKEQARKLHESEQEKEQLSQCTFKPSTNVGKLRNSRSSSLNRTGQIKGFDKAVSRLKQGFRKHTEQSERKSQIPVGKNYEKLRKKEVKGPSFLERKNGQKDENLFSIGLEIGSKKAVLKIRAKDTASSAAHKICQIYGLNARFQAQLEELVQKQMDAYWEMNI